jgi:hypothetical protein
MSEYVAGTHQLKFESVRSQRNAAALKPASNDSSAMRRCFKKRVPVLPSTGLPTWRWFSGRYLEEAKSPDIVPTSGGTEPDPDALLGANLVLYLFSGP